MTALFAAAIAALPTSPALAMNIQTVKSPGGIEAWLVEDGSVPLVALRFAFVGGNSQDPNEKPGVAHFVTSMLDEGAGDLDARAFQERMEEIAMKMSYDDSRDLIYGSLQSLSENLDESAELLSLALTKPRFDQDAVERVRGQLLANLSFASKSPQQIATKAWFKAAFGDHPYGRETNGTLDSVKAITPDDLHAYVKANFARDNLRVVAVGDISAERLGALLDKVFGGLPETADLKPVADVTLPTGGKQKVIELDVPQSVALFGLPSLARKDPDFIPAFVLNHILGGGGFSSKLMEEVREKRGLAYSVYSYLNPLDHSAIMQGSVATKNEAIAESLDVIRAELEKIAKDGVSPEDLKAAQDYLTGSYALRFDSNSKIASQLLGIRVEELGLDYVNTRNKQIEAVGVTDVKRAASRFLDPDDLITVIVGKPEGIEVRG
ncbi:MAG: pitrilysin family protein [Pseudomonadota bacterium]